MSEGYSVEYVESRTAQELALEMERLSNARIKASNDLLVASSIITSIVHVAGGKVEGLPTTRINILQRIRELVAVETSAIRRANLNPLDPDDGETR